MADSLLRAKKISLAIAGFLIVFFGLQRSSSQEIGNYIPLPNFGSPDFVHADAPGGDSSGSASCSGGDSYCETSDSSCSGCAGSSGSSASPGSSGCDSSGTCDSGCV